MAGPRWVRLDVEYFHNPKTSGVTPVAQVLHLASICWAGAHLTDGHIPAHIVPQLRTAARAKPEHVAQLVAARLWIPVGDGFEIHDYLAMQDSREQVERRRKRTAERITKWRADRDM